METSRRVSEQVQEDRDEAENEDQDPLEKQQCCFGEFSEYGAEDCELALDVCVS